MAFGVLPQGVWDTGTLDWVRMTQPGGGAGAGGLTDTELRASAVSTVDTVLLSVLDTNSALRVDLASIGGLATPIAVGHGVSGLDVQRVEIASDGTGQVKLAASAAVIGHVINDASAAVIGHVIADTGSTTAVTGNVAVTNAGLTNLDVALSTRTKPADQQHAIIDSGTTVVTQPTGTNLHVVVDTAPTTAVTSAGLTNLDVALSTRTKPADQQHAIIDSGTVTTVSTVTAVTSITNPVAVTGPLTDTQLRATPVPVSGTVTATGPLTDTQLRATAVPVSGTVAATIAAALNATATNSEPQYVEAAASALTQNLNGQLRVVEDIQPMVLDALTQILLELKVQNLILHATLNSRDDLDQLRSAFNPSLGATSL